MKIMEMKAIALLLFFSMHSFDHARAQSAPVASSARHQAPPRVPQPAQVVVVQPPLTDYERYRLYTDQPLVTLTFPVISADVGADISLTLTPRGLTPFDAPDVLKAVAVDFNISQSLPAARGTEVSPIHSVTSLARLRGAVSIQIFVQLAFGDRNAPATVSGRQGSCSHGVKERPAFGTHIRTGRQDQMHRCE